MLENETIESIGDPSAASDLVQTLFFNADQARSCQGRYRDCSVLCWLRSQASCSLAPSTLYRWIS